MKAISGFLTSAPGTILSAGCILAFIILMGAAYTPPATQYASANVTGRVGINVNIDAVQTYEKNTLGDVLFTSTGSGDTAIYKQLGGGSITYLVNGDNGIVQTDSSIAFDADDFMDVNGRWCQSKGANITAATNITTDEQGNFFLVTGNTQIETMLGTNWQAGSKVTLMFSGTPNVMNAGTGTGLPFLLAAADTFEATANDILKVVSNGTNWIETDRSVN